jgi:hypothetical protein
VAEIDAARTFEALQQLQKEEGENTSRKVRGLRNGLRTERLLEILRLDDSLMNPILAA